MILYTIIPLEAVFDWETENGFHEFSTDEVLIKQGSVSLLTQPLPGGQYKINRIISTDPQDYLKPEWQPGSIMSLF
jgi:hypothetical protein